MVGILLVLPLVILGLEGTPEGVDDRGKLTRVAALYICRSFFHSFFAVYTLEKLAIHFLTFFPLTYFCYMTQVISC